MAKYLKQTNTFEASNAIRKFKAYLRIAQSMGNKVMAEKISLKIQALLDKFESRFNETALEGGQILVKHPGIGFITVQEKLCDEPVRLFASKAKSLSLNTICVYQADALVLANGNIEYINRVKLLEVDMSQIEFSRLISNPGRGRFPATIREINGVQAEYEGDLNGFRSQRKLEQTLELTEGMNQWITALKGDLEAVKSKSGAMSRKAKDQLIKNADVLQTWALRNPAYAAKTLAEFTDESASEVKMEIIAAVRIKERHP